MKHPQANIIQMYRQIHADMDARVQAWTARRDAIATALAEMTEEPAELKADLATREDPAPAGAGKPGRRMSAAGARRIAAAQKKRWAEYYKEHGKPANSKAGKKPKRVLSPAARKRIADATRKRWIAYRAQKAAAAKTK